MKILKIFILSIIIMNLLIIPAFAIAHTTTHSAIHSSTHITTSHSSTGKSSSTTKAASATKTYTTPKNFVSKYNSSNIKTEKVNSNPTNFEKYSSSNIFKPNFWTSMWLFTCMNNNTKEATEQDIAKELEERGYTEEEVKEILQEGEKAKNAEQEEQKNNKIGKETFGIVCTIILILLIIALFLMF